MFFSFSIWSTCLLWIISCFFIDLMANFLLGSLRSQPTFTRPKAPIVTPTSGSKLEDRGLTFAESVSKDYVFRALAIKDPYRHCSFHHYS